MGLKVGGQAKTGTATVRDSIQLLARISLRHEDELAQSRTEKEFVLTFEVHGGGIPQWQQRLEKMEQQEAREGAIKLGVALRNPQDQSLE